MKENEEFHKGAANLEQTVTQLKNYCLTNNAPPEIHKLVDEIASRLAVQRQKSESGMGLTAQVSIYPLRQASLSPAIADGLKIFREEGLEVEPGSMSTLIAGSDQAIWRALQNTFSAAASQGETVMIVTVSNACPWPLSE